MQDLPFHPPPSTPSQSPGFPTAPAASSASPAAAPEAPPVLPPGILGDAILVLQQARTLLETLSPGAFTHAHPGIYNSGVGPHLRHAIDHFDGFFNGLEAGCIDYDARKRDPRLETDQDFAITRIAQLIQATRNVPATDLCRVVESRMNCGCSEETCQSTVRRELQFLISHTIHHYALMALILRHQGIDPGPEFGMAPSTLRHRERTAPCAP